MVTFCTTSFNIRKFYRLLTDFVAYGSQNKQRLFPFAAVPDCFFFFYITETESVYCAVRAESVNTIQVNLSVSARNSAATNTDFIAPNARLLLSNELVRILQIVIFK